MTLEEDVASGNVIALSVVSIDALEESTSKQEETSPLEITET